MGELNGPEEVNGQGAAALLRGRLVGVGAGWGPEGRGGGRQLVVGAGAGAEGKQLVG